ncbi:metal ABC transporter permease [Candidatus Dependentiae bacterium]
MIETQFLLALVMCFLVGSCAGYIGSLMVTKRMALMGGALGHLTLPGITIALIYNFDVSIGALLF